MVGKTILHYKILEKLGEGGMGIVHKAKDTKLDRIVAIKFLPREFSSDETAKKRFKIEAKAAASLNHPNITTIYQIEEEDDQLFIVMEFIEGQELKQLVFSNRSISEKDTTDYALQMAEGLQAAHEKGVVHRDIKSTNIMVTNKGQIKIMDFGLAKLSGQSQITKEGSTLGTISYMSPEQAKGDVVDHRSDIWSFGVVLYEMLTGQVPFKGDYEQAVIFSILNEDPEPISEQTMSSHNGLSQLLIKTLTKDPNDRYQGMGEVVTELMAIYGRAQTSLPPRKEERHTVGREQELQELDSALQNTFAGKSLLVGIGGEPGIGKTTVVEEFIEEVSLSGRSCVISRGQCSERLAGTDGYLPFLEVLENLLRDDKDASVKDLMREKAPWWYVQVASISPDDPANAAILADAKIANQERVKRELSTFFQDLSHQKPVVLLIEDIHWADVSSIDTIAYLATKFDAMKLLIITTYRPTELQLSKHPFLQIKPDLLSRGQCIEISLDFLPKEEVDHYLKLEFTNHHFPADFSKLIHGKTEGSPLFMVTMLRDLKDRQVIDIKDDVWQLTESIGEINLDLPDSVKGMIDRKIQQITDKDRRLLEVASIQGFEFDSAVIGNVLDLDEEDVEERLQALDQEHHFIQFVEEDEFPDRTMTIKYRFVHVLYQNEMCSSLTRTKWARISRVTAEILEGFYGEKSDKVAAELAKLFEAAREIEKAIKYYIKASEHAVGVFAFQEAIALAGGGLKLLETLPMSREKDLAELSFQAFIGGSLSATKGYGDESVGKVYSRVRELSKQTGLDKETVVAVAGLIPFFNVTVQLDKTIELCSELIELATKDNNIPLIASAKSGYGMAQQFLGNFTSGESYFDEVIKLEQMENQDSATALAGWDTVIYNLGHHALNNWVLGFPDRALSFSEEARSRAEESKNPYNLSHYYGFAGFLYQHRGAAEKVMELTESSLRIARENAYYLNIAWATMQKGWAVSENGNADQGLEMLTEGLVTWRAVGMVAMVPYWHSLIADIYGQLDQPDNGLPLLEESIEIVERTNHRFFESELYRIKGKLLHIKGDNISEAESCHQKALEIARTQKAKSYELRAGTDLSRLWQEQGKNKDAKKMLLNIYNSFSEGYETNDLRAAQIQLDEL